MKKKLLAALLVLTLCPRVFAQADMIADAIKDVIKDKIEGDIGNLASKAYLAELCTYVYLGKADKPVENLLGNYDPSGLPKDVALKILERLVPEAAGPVGVLLMMNDAAYTGVEYFQDWAKETNMAVFKREVIDKAKTPEQMDALWNTFQQDYVYTESADRGIFYADRADFLRQMKAAYAVARKHLAVEIARREAPAKLAEAKEKAIKRLNWIKKDAELKVNGIVSMLKLTGTPVTTANIKRALKDTGYNNELVKKWWAEVDKAAAAKDAARLPPSGDPNLDKATALMGDAKKQAAAGNTAPDYGPLLREYGLNADRLLTNNVSASEYANVRDALRSAAASLNDACTGPHVGNMSYAGQEERRRLQGLVEACNKNLQAHYTDQDAVDKRLYDYAMKLKADLEALTMGGWKAVPLSDLKEKLKAELYATPQGQGLEKADGVMDSVENDNADEAHSHWAKYSWEGKKDPPLEQLKRYRDGMAARGALYETLVSQAQDKATQYEKAIKEFEETYNANSAKYAALFQQNSGMADRFGVEQYRFATQVREMETARASLNDEYCTLSPAFIEKRRSRGGLARKEQAAWNSSIALNEKFITDFTPAREEMKKLAVWTGPKGPMQLGQKNLEDYYDANLKEFMVNFLQGALILLDENTRGQFMTGQPQEAKPFGSGYKTVMEIADTPAYASLPEHNAKLEEFRKKLAELKDLDLEGRAARAAAIQSGMEAALAKIGVRSAETGTLYAEINTESAKRGNLIGYCNAYSVNTGDACLAYAIFDEKFKAYEAKIRKSEEYEKKALEACNKSIADPAFDYRDFTAHFFGGKKWKPSPQIVKVCGAADKIKWDLSVKEFRKYTPFQEVTIAGRPLAGDLQLKKGDLPGGRAVVRGTLHPDAPAYAQVYVSLNGDYAHAEPGHTVPVSGGAFEFSFEPAQGETYYVGVQAIGGPDGRQSQTLPSNGHITLKMAGEDMSAQVQAFYDRFKSAYEARNAPAVMALLSPDWTAAGEDTALTDLEENLRANFRLYDEIKFSVSGLKVTSQGGTHQACYDTVITSRIFKRNLKHEEKASVCDELKEEGGKLRISRTLSGRYWYVK